MFHHFVGRVIEKSPAHIVLECGGVGYYLNISLTTFGQIGEAKEVKLLTHAVYREDAQLLFGFHTGVERDVFLLLLSVSGVGANTAWPRVVIECWDLHRLLYSSQPSVRTLAAA